MCRFVAYKGNEILMANLLSRAEHSLIAQSYRSREREEPHNGDGFGVGWYLKNDPIPCFFTSIAPAWSNLNLHRLSEKISSSCLFAHVRAASSGLQVSEVNCHPFQYGPFLWMHNGLIGAFQRIKRTMRDALSDRYYDMIQGTTDSEHAFALYLETLGSAVDAPTPESMREAMEKTIGRIVELSLSADPSLSSYLNFAVTNGETVLVTRYVSHADETPPSLYYSCGSTFELKERDFRMKRDGQAVHTVIVSSEPLTTVREDWIEVPRNSILTVTGEMKVEITPVSIGQASSIS